MITQSFYVVVEFRSKSFTQQVEINLKIVTKTTVSNSFDSMTDVIQTTRENGRSALTYSEYVVLKYDNASVSVAAAQRIRK